MKKILTYKYFSLLVIAVLAFVPHVIASSLLIVAGLVYSYLVIRTCFIKAPKVTKFSKFIISVCFYTFTLQLSSMAIWNFNYNAHLHWTIVIANAVAVITYILLAKNKQRDLSVAINSGDIIALCVALILVGGIILQSIARYPVSSPISVIALVDGNVDDGAHLAMINDRVEFDLGITTRSDTESRSRLGNSASSYPVGWHTANAAVLKAFNPSATVGYDTLQFYTASKIFWFTIIVFLFARLTLFITELSKKNRSITIAATALIVIFSYYFLVDQYRLGFYSFFPQLASIILVAYSLMALRSERTADPSTFTAIIPLAIFAVGGGLSWTLLLPVLGVVILTSFFKIVRDMGMSAIQPFYCALPVVVISMLAVATQLRLIRGASGNVGESFLDAINTYGNIAVYNQMFFLMIILGLLALIYNIRHEQRLTQIKAVMSLTTGLLIFTAIIYLIQIISVEKNTYYFYKILSTFFYIAIPLAIAGAASSIAKFSSSILPYTAPALIITSLFLLIGFPAGNSPTVSYLSGKLGLNPSEAEVVYEEVIKGNRDASEVNRYEFIYEPSRPAQADIANVLMKSIPVYDKCYDTVRPSFTDGTKPKDLAEILNRACKEKDVVIITKSEFFDDLQQELAKYNLKNVTLQPLK